MLVSVVWFSFAGQQNVDIAIEPPLALKNLPSQLEVDPAIQKITTTARGQRKDIGMLSSKNVKATIDLSRADAGEKNYILNRQQILLPNDRVDIVGIEPSSVTLKIRLKTER